MIDQYWTYHWWHLPSGNYGVKVLDRPMSRCAFLECLNRWNEAGRGDWLYTEARALIRLSKPDHK